MFANQLVIPFRCDPLSDLPSREAWEAVERTNASVLGFLLQGVDLDAMPRPADERLAEALAPVRIKLDMITNMISRFLYRDVALPASRNVELGPNRIAWRYPLAVQCGACFRIELYFDAIFREPLVIFGRVVSSVEQGQDDGYRIEAQLIEMSERIGEGLLRLVFLTQRHQRARYASKSARSNT